MGSRATLSFLAALTGAVVMYTVLSFLGDAPGTAHSTATMTIVFLGLACIGAGWIRIFTRRPNPRGGGE